MKGKDVPIARAEVEDNLLVTVGLPLAQGKEVTDAAVAHPD
jgi:hypothetical protein